MLCLLLLLPLTLFMALPIGMCLSQPVYYHDPGYRCHDHGYRVPSAPAASTETRK